MQLYSHSRLSSFENCPRQFKFRYVEKIKTERESVESFVGKRVHEILERLYHHVGRYGRPPSLAQVVERFQKDWQLHFHGQVHIVRDENDLGHYQDLGARCLENYYRSHYPFDDGETVGIEEHIQLALDPAGRYRVRGIIDRIVRRPGGRYEIHDYKTGGYVPPKKRLDGDRQLALYQIGLEQRYDDVEDVTLVWHYVAFNKTLTSSRTPDQLSALREETIGRIDEIESAADYPAKTGPLCRWCEYRDLCPEGAGSFGRRDGPPGAEPPGPGPVLEAPGVEAPPAGEPVQLSLL